MKFIGFYDYTVILTYMSVVSAVYGMTRAACGSFGLAVICLAVSGICDAFDGAVARTKPNRTEDEKSFGIQLDSICDVISFGVHPAFICYSMGVDGFFGLSLAIIFCLCAVIRLAFFNVLEINRQKTEDCGRKTYRGLPVTAIAVVFPLVYLLRPLVSEEVFVGLLYIMLGVIAFLFVLDFTVVKPDLKRIFSRNSISEERDF